jgi:uncharacterized protein YndB with AHSA1/START domain
MPAKTEPRDERTTTDRIEKQFFMRAPRARVWRAVSTAKEFGTWFRMNLDGEFAVGAAIRGRLTYPGYEHVTMDLLIERIEPEGYFSYRWHPYASDPKADFSTEPTTLVEFRLEERDGGTAVTIVESGFDQLPLARQAEAFRMNNRGWTTQAENLQKHVA